MDDATDSSGIKRRLSLVGPAAELGPLASVFMGFFIAAVIQEVRHRGRCSCPWTATHRRPGRAHVHRLLAPAFRVVQPRAKEPRLDAEVAQPGLLDAFEPGCTLDVVADGDHHVGDAAGPWLSSKLGLR